MVMINTDCHNYSVPPGSFGGAMCICHKCVAERKSKSESPKSGAPSGQTDFDLLACAKYHEQQGSEPFCNLEVIRETVKEENAQEGFKKYVAERQADNKKRAKMLRDIAGS